MPTGLLRGLSLLVFVVAGLLVFAASERAQATSSGSNGRIEASPGVLAALPLTWGDNNCSGAHDPFDALATLVDESGIEADGCPTIGSMLETAAFGTRIWGDLDCSGVFGPPDVLILLRDAAGLPPANLQDCPALGIEVALQTG